MILLIGLQIPISRQPLFNFNGLFQSRTLEDSKIISNFSLAFFLISRRSYAILSFKYLFKSCPYQLDRPIIISLTVGGHFSSPLYSMAHSLPKVSQSRRTASSFFRIDIDGDESIYVESVLASIKSPSLSP